ncbi:S-layer homology domain-containing protein [Paenibacillus sp. LHD-38]|uniref:S-layer homology domain-containing protein n=1 Tax=Paenibacillus sp. LHD-38 TaxID=3072143 RepID=UPI00280DD031|nr:S-layer homology domain-containing protein [Paenibacillus sp. LHD-38]MDQ8736047.1 S-layer homology domain-containing protein [Paenibacillus sp. LHD-38]
MRKRIATVLIFSLVVMLLQQWGSTSAVSAAAPEPFIYPTKDKFYDGVEVLNGESGKNYMGYDKAYGTGEHKTYLQFPLAEINASKTLQSVKLVIPILNGYVSRSQSTVDPYISVYKSITDDWIEAVKETSELPIYHPVNDFIEKKSFDFLTSSSGLLLEYDVTPFISTQLESSDQQASFILSGPTASDTNPGATGIVQNMIMFNQQEADGTTGLPYLVYEYAPNQPPTGTIAIQNGDLYANNTSVTLNLTYTDPEGDEVEVQFSNNNVDWSTKESITSTKAWNLASGDGLKTVYMKLTDEAGNTAVLSDSISLDTVAPIIGGVSNLQKSKETVTITIAESNLLSSLLNGSSITSGHQVTAEGSYSLAVTDKAGNITALSFSIDKTLPTVSGVTNGTSYNTDRQPSYADNNAGVTAKLNGSSFASGDSITAEGDYSLVVTDAYGNSVTVTFTIDKTSPNGSVVIAGGAAKTNSASVSLAVTGTDAQALTMQFSNDHTTWSTAEPFSSSKAWSIAGGDGIKTVYLKLTDEAGNAAEFNDTVTLDTTAPVITGIANGDVVNRDVTLSFDEGTAQLNGEAFASGTTISAAGAYVLVVTDELGHAATVSFEIDKTAPTGSLSIENGKSYVKDKAVALKIAFEDIHAVQMRFSNNGSDWDDGDWAAADVTKSWSLTDGGGEKTVYLQLRDAAGNTNEYIDTIIVDSVLPLITGVSDGDKLNHDAVITFNKGTAQLNGNDFSSGSSVSAEGNHTLVVTDEAGNMASVSFSIDKTRPTVSGAADGAFYNTDRQPTFADNNTGVAAKLNGSSYASGTSITAEGDYSLVVTDAYGNSVNVLFTIDKTAPSGSIVINDGDLETTGSFVKLSLEGTDASAVMKQLSNHGTAWTAVPLADWELSNGFGEKTVYLELTDAAGNKKVVSDTILYRSIPVMNNSSVNGLEDTELHFGINDFLYTNADSKTLDEITIVSLPANGKLMLNGAEAAANVKVALADLAHLSFVPDQDWSGLASFEWKGAAFSVPAVDSVQMLIHVAPVNDAPSVQNASFSTTSSAKVEGQLTAGDVDNDSITFAVVVQPAKGKLTLDAANGKFSYEPEAGYYEDVTFTYKANDGQADSNTASVTIVNHQPASSGNGLPSAPLVEIEGISNQPGVKAEVVLKDGKPVLVVSLNGEKLTEIIKNLKDNELTIDVGDAHHNVELAMDLALIKQLNSSGSTIKLVQGGTGYGLSASAIRDVLKDWKNATAQLKIEIKQADAATSAKLEQLAKDKGYSLLVTPISYQLYFQIGETRINLSSIKGYITISYGQDELKGKQPKTAVLLLPNGKLVHVPTKISNLEGQFEIKVHSFANGIFTLIDYKKTFEDVEGWSKVYVEELASRLVVQGTGDETFEPDRGVTRAEFSAIITGALGLYMENGTEKFSDVSEDSWYAASLAAASEYGLINGYADGTFRPNEEISREEAMVILARSFDLMELKPTFSQEELNASLASFEDNDELNSWSRASIQLTVLLGIVNGSNNQLHPSEPMTREQLAAVIVKLLKTGQFI